MQTSNSVWGDVYAIAKSLEAAAEPFQMKATLPEGRQIDTFGFVFAPKSDTTPFRIAEIPLTTGRGREFKVVLERVPHIKDSPYTLRIPDQDVALTVTRDDIWRNLEPGKTYARAGRMNPKIFARFFDKMLTAARAG